MLTIVILLLGSLIVLAAGLVVRRFELSESLGFSLALSLLGILIVLMPAPLKGLLGYLSESLLVYAKNIGLIGLFFLMGTNFSYKNSLWTQRTLRLALLGIAQIIIIVLLLANLGGLTLAMALTIAVALASTSLWPTTLEAHTNKSADLIVVAQSAATFVIGFSLVAVHFTTTFQAISSKHLPQATFMVVALYEVLKAVMFFSIAGFISSRFLTLTKGSFSKVRSTFVYLLLIALLFILAISTLGILAAVTWSFIAGAIFNYSKTEKEINEEYRPLATALFLTLIFLSVILQWHGRSLNSPSLLLFMVIVGMGAKFALGWLAARISGFSKGEAYLLAAAMLGTGETAILFLSFGMSKWLIDGPYFFSIVAFTLLSTTVSLLIRRLLNKTSISNKQPHLIGKPIRTKNYRKNKAITVAIMGIIMLSGTIAKAQSTTQKDNEDPVSRTLRNMNMAASQHVIAAEQAIAVSKQLKESVLAQKAGETGKALARLAEAEKLAIQNSEGQNSLMLKELLSAIAIQRLQLTPQPTQSQITTTNSSTLISLPRYRTAFARFQQYSEHLRQILTEEKAPTELLSIAIIESGLNPQALSPKGARGIWQFMPGTARRYGLPVDATTDHRIDPEHSTRAAARYLLDLYNQFGDWKLALAAYNAGETKIQRIIERTGIRDFDEMARRGYLPVETRNYVPAVLAIWLQLGGTNLLTFPRKPSEASKTLFSAPGQIIEAPMILKGKED